MSIERTVNPIIALLLAALALPRFGLSAAESEADEARQAERRQIREAAEQLVNKWDGERWYALHNKGARAPGWLRLNVKEKDGFIILDDELFISQAGQEARHLQALQCRADEYLTPVSISIEALRPQKPWVIGGEIKDGG